MSDYFNKKPTLASATRKKPLLRSFAGFPMHGSQFRTHHNDYGSSFVYYNRYSESRWYLVEDNLGAKLFKGSLYKMLFQAKLYYCVDKDGTEFTGIVTLQNEKTPYYKAAMDRAVHIWVERQDDGAGNNLFLERDDITDAPLFSDDFELVLQNSFIGRYIDSPDHPVLK